MSRSTSDPEALHPSLWRAHQMGRAIAAVVPTGFALLDAHLPGGGWPCGALTELLLRPGVGEMRLLAPCLAAVVAAGRPLMCFDPPARLCAQALDQLGIDTRRLIVVQGRDRTAASAACPPSSAADLFWALEQTLRSGSAGAVLAWLPATVRTEALRRLQGAAQAQSGPFFVLRGVSARLKPSPAVLRLQLDAASVPDELAVQLLKRRGPPLAEPLHLLLPPVLTPSQRARARARVRLPVPMRAHTGDLLTLG